MSNHADNAILAGNTENILGLTNQHYNLDVRLFRLFLDSSLKYSSGLYLHDNDLLEKAQIQKMEFIANQLGLQGGERVLDVGCGWGSLLCFLADRYHCSTFGITPSESQANYICNKSRELGLTGRVRVVRGNFEQIEFNAGSFDAIKAI